VTRIALRLAACAVVAGVIVAGAQPALAAAPVQPAAKPAARSAAGTATNTGPAGVRAPYAELIDAATGKDLWSRSSATEVPMGSITKVMTAYLVIKAGDLNRVITVPAGIVAYDDEFGASTAGLEPGEKLTALQLLYALLLPSGCDAAYTLATAYGPGRAAFIGKMNAMAAKLGLTRTHFSDFSGLPDPTEYSTYSTASNLAGLGRAAMKLPLLRQIVATRTYKLAKKTGSHPAFSWQNLNPLLGKYRGAAGIKTGFTNAAGDCLLFAAVRGKRELIGVVLDSSSSPDGLNVAGADAKVLLNWGFSR
jgi:serine-type D-Ala-D-Ala carboxypeptidase (penicillin-binding protein 5/6)